MSAAATAAGYLYASGRLRGRNAREGEPGHEEHKDRERNPAPARREVRVAAYRPDAPAEPRAPRRDAPRRVPKIEYRTRRWRPE